MYAITKNLLYNLCKDLCNRPVENRYCMMHAYF